MDGCSIKIGGQIQGKYNCNQNELAHIKIVFIVDLDFQSYNHYLQQPKPMIVRNICKIIDKNPNLIKTMKNMPEPFLRHIIVKHWGFRREDIRGIMQEFIPDNWELIDYIKEVI